MNVGSGSPQSVAVLTGGEGGQGRQGRQGHAGGGLSPAVGSDRRWMVLPVLCLSVFLVVVDNTIVNVALPTLNRELGASITSLQWIVDAYSLAFAGLLLAGGGIGDRLGRKGTMQVGLVFFGLFSAAAAVSDSTGTLIAARALMGVAAAFIFPASLAILASIAGAVVAAIGAAAAFTLLSGRPAVVREESPAPCAQLPDITFAETGEDASCGSGTALAPV